MLRDGGMSDTPSPFSEWLKMMTLTDSSVLAAHIVDVKDDCDKRFRIQDSFVLFLPWRAVTLTDNFQKTLVSALWSPENI